MVANFQDENLLWSKIREMRGLNIEKYTNSCFALVSDNIISEHFQNLSTILNIVIDDDDFDEKVKNLSEITIQKGVEMFFYLNSCENKEVKNYWINFYGTMMFKQTYLGFDVENRSIKEILLSSCKSMHISKSKDGQKIANKFVKRLSSDAKFQYLQPNNDESNFNWIRNLRNVKGNLCNSKT